MIIFNEKDYAERVIKSGYFQTLKFQGQERRAVAKYLKYEKGYTDQQIKDAIIDIKSRRKEMYDADIWDNIMDKLIINYDKSEYLCDIKVGISQSELDVVLAQPTIELRNLLFSLLVYYKWASQTRERTFVRKERVWVREADLDCCKLAHLDSLKRDERISLFGDLYKTHLYDTDYVRKYRNIFTLTFVDNKEPVLIIDEFGDILAHLEKYLQSNKYTECSECGSLIFKTSNRRRLCKMCVNNRKHRKNQKGANRK